MGYFKKIESNLGACAELKCPHCLTETRFQLRKQAAALNVFQVPLLELDKIYQLHCPRCKYFKHITDREIFAAGRAVKLFAKLQTGVLTAVDYAAGLEKLDFPSLKELLAAASWWTCPQCAEPVPANFSECWKCKQARLDLKASPAAESFVAPKLHPDLTRPANPWE